MKTTRTQRMLMKLFPNTTDRIWSEAFTMGKENGTKNEQSKVAQRLRANHVKDFGKASLTLPKRPEVSWRMWHESRCLFNP